MLELRVEHNTNSEGLKVERERKSCNKRNLKQKDTKAVPCARLVSPPPPS